MHLFMFEKWLAEKRLTKKGLEDEVASRWRILTQGYAFIASEANLLLGC